MRTWKCPECAWKANISYERLARDGEPVCSTCDCEMELQPGEEPEMLEVLQRLAAYLSTHDPDFWASNADAAKARKILGNTKRTKRI